MNQNKRKELEALKEKYLKEKRELATRADHMATMTKNFEAERLRRSKDAAAGEELVAAKEALAKAELRHKAAHEATQEPARPGGVPERILRKEIDGLNKQIEHLDSLLYSSCSPAKADFHTMPPHRPRLG